MKRILSITFLVVLCNILAKGQTGWERQYPLSNNNELKSVCFTDANTGYAVGVGGTILKTTDAGINWKLNIFGTTALNDITFTSPDTGYAVGKYGTILKTTDAGATWLALSSNTQTSLNSVCFANNNTGFAVGYNKIIKTTDGGATWTSYTSGTYNNLNTVCFTNDTTGYIMGNSSLKTTNAGVTWSLMPNAPTGIMTDLSFVDESTGYATGFYDSGYGYSSRIYKTTDSGTTWTVMTNISNMILTSFYFNDANNGYAVGFNSGSVGSFNSTSKPWFFKTTDGGATWIVQNRGTNAGLNSVFFTDMNTGYSVGHGGVIYKTTDAGQIWIPQAQELDNSLISVCFTDSNTGFAVGNGTIIKTTNAGITWTAQTNVYIPTLLTSLSFPTTDTGYAVGKGIILKTTNAGATWFIPTDFSTESFNDFKSVFFTASNTGYILKSDSTILKTTDGGTTWARTSVSGFSFMTSMTDVFFTNTNIGYIVGKYGKIRKTTDAGASWVTLNSGTTKPISSVFFVDMNTGFAVGDSGLMLKTINAGATWTTLNVVSTSYLMDVYFTDTNNGYVTTNGGGVYKTTNGGSSWTLYDSSFYFKQLYFTDSNTGYGVNTNGVIYKTTNAGINWSVIKNGFSNHLMSVYFVDNNTGYSVGYYGTMLKTTNAGKDWIVLPSGENATLSQVYFTDPNMGFALGSRTTAPNHIALKTTNAGATWSQYSIPGSNILDYTHNVYFIDTNTGFIYSDRQIFKTENGGTTWSIVYNAAVGSIITTIKFVDQNNGFAYNSNEKSILRTTNGGNSWAVAGYFNSTYYFYFQSFHFTDSNTGYAVGNEEYRGVIYKTINAGSTWNKIYQDPNYYTTNSFSSIFFVDLNTGFAVGSNGAFLKTTNAGATWNILPSGTGTWLNSCHFTDENNGCIVGNDGLILKTFTGGEYVNNNIDSLKITSLRDSSQTNSCSALLNANIQINSLFSGPLFNVGDSIDFQVWFGDGTDTIYSKTIDHLPSKILCNLEHNYPSYGVYSVKCRITAPDGRSDSLSINDLITFYPEYIINESHSICEGDNYSWHGQNLSTAGTYYDNYTSINGCDSLYTLNLEIISTTSSTSDIAVCTSALPYTWNGLTFTTAGSQTATLTSITGCDSLATLNLTLNPTSGSNNPVSICMGESFVFNGHTYTTTGNYNDTLQSIHGCDSIVTTNLTVNAPSITGSVVYSGGLLNAGTASVILFKEEVSGNFQQIDSVIVGPNGSFAFQNMPDGNYHLYVNLTDSSTYPDLFNTYLDSTIEWQNAAFLTLNCNTDTNVIIHMVETAPSNPGNGHITGTIHYYTSNKTIGDPLPGVEIYVRSESNNEPVANCASKANGMYEFTQIPNGNYSIYIDIPGIPMIETYTGINVTASDTLFENLNFYVDTTTLSAGIYTDEILSVSKIETPELSVNLFPNPVKNELSIEVSNKTEGLTIEVIDINGKSLYKTTSGNHAKIEMNAFATGVYLIKIQSKNTVIFKKIIKE